MTKVGLHVKFTTRPGQRDALVEQLLHAAALVKDVPGCEIYIVATSPSEADVVWVTEVWASEADHDASLTLDGAKDAIARALPLLAGPPQRTDTLPVGGKGLASS
jgi:quinol monooxygenase YgiN